MKAKIRLKLKTSKILGLTLTGLILMAGSRAFSAPAINSGSPACAWPHNVAYSYGLKPNHVSFATMNAAVSTLYVNWYTQFVTATGAGGFLRIQRDAADGNDTVSEGIGYGMLIAVMMADKTLFDGLYNYMNIHRDANQLMNWKISSGGGTTGTNGATDADEDICMALLMADKQWGSGGAINYKTQFQTMINSIWLYETPSSIILPGDAYSTPLFSSYMTPAWYRCWGAAGNDTNAAHNWTLPTNWVYGTFLANCKTKWPNGMVPNCINNGAPYNTSVPIPGGTEGANSMGYDASRWPMRIGLDYLWNGQTPTQIQAFATTIIGGVSANGYINYIQEYWDVTTGVATGSPCSSLQIGPALIAVMSTANQSFVNSTWDELWNRVNSAGCPGLNYFQDTLALQCALIASGNFPNLVCAGASACVATTPVPTATPQPCFMLDTFEDGNAQDNTNGYWFTFSYVSVANTPVAPTRSGVSGPTYIVDGTATGGGAVAGSSFAGRVTGYWQDNGLSTPATYGGFALAAELNTGFRNLVSQPGGCGPMTQISFYVKGTAGCTLRLNFFNPAIDVTGGGNGNQYGYNIAVTTVWQQIVVPLVSIACQNWGAGTCPPVSGGTTYTQTLALSNVTSLQWQTQGNPATIGFWLDNICMTFQNCKPNTPTPLPTLTPLPQSPTNTPLPTNTATLTPTNTTATTPTRTPTNSPTNSPTNTATNSPTRTPTNSPTNTIGANTNTPTNSPTRTSTNTPTNSPTNTFTNTATRTPTSTPTNSITNTPAAPTNTATLSPTLSPTRTPTPTLTNSPTNSTTNTATKTPTSTPSNTITYTSTNTPAITNTASNTPTITPTNTPSRTATATPTPTSTNTLGNTATNTPSRTPSNTPSSTPTNTFTNTPTRTPTTTPTQTPTNSSTATPTRTPTSTATNSLTPTITSTFTDSPTGTLAPTNTATLSPTNTPSSSPTKTPTNSPSNTPSVTPSNTPTNSATLSPSNTSTNTPLASTTTPTNSPTQTPTSTFTNTFTPTFTPTTVTISVANGVVPPNTSQPPGAVNVPVMQYVLSNTSASAATISTMTLTASGTGVDNTGITGVNLYLDNNGNGVVDGGDTLLGSATYGSDNGTAVVPVADTIPASGTATYLVSYTFSGSAPAGTYQSTLNPSVNFTGTNSLGAVNFSGPVINSAVITIVGFTATPTNTFTSTSTATPETVVVSQGAASPPNSTQLPGVFGLPVLQIQAVNTGNATATINSVNLKASGSGNDAAGITGISLYLDSNNNGTVDAGDVLLSTGTYPSDNGNAVLNFSSPIPPAGTSQYLVTYNFSGAAPAGTYQASLVNNSDLTGVNGTTGQPVLFSGASLNGALITLAAATQTPTPTITITPSFTATLTPTNTNTLSAATKTPTIVIYPNPVDGTNPIHINLPALTGTSNIKVKIYTAAFRKVLEQNFNSQPVGVDVDVNLKDKWGTPLASGLYYVVVFTEPSSNTGQAPGRSVGKLLIER